MELNRVNDLYFKYLMGSEQRKEITIRFLNDTLYGQQPVIQDITFLNNEMILEDEREKLSRLDILADTGNGYVDIEVQLRNHRKLAERFLYYWAKLYSRELNPGDSYDTLRPTVSIILMNFSFLQEPDWHNVYHIYNDRSRRKLTEDFGIHTIELPKFSYSDVKKLYGLSKWTAYFTNCSTTDVEAMAMGDPVMEKVLQAQERFVHDDALWTKYMLREKAIRDYNSDIKEALETGMAQGMEKGIETNRLETALAMLRHDLPVSMIAACTKLTEPEIIALAKEHHIE
ncbi:Rpn family recombination-promoting nuclease/putative transposase [uncultured Megasphaera sp.]|uniref:Rpn family recombination-promoting nuclease/putative transposase n=1 Tax=uncultured Megasphaera sp. TaxID=165188 RepID=UPI00265A9294|nr:Rpn family recombination-promoting nuclease/putative transposase [uncultured Megasphaera sp.]